MGPEYRIKLSLLKVFLGILAPLLVIGFAAYKAHSGSYGIYMNKHLSVVHEKLERRCNVCHTPWEGVYNDSCYKCHHDECGYYESLIEESEDYSDNVRCYDCHSEHLGKFHNLMAVNEY
jgi:hypothetical protein